MGRRQRRIGKSGWGFETDYLAGDAEFVFFLLIEKCQYEMMNERRYFFAFDSHRLISDYDALIQHNLIFRKYIIKDSYGHYQCLLSQFNDLDDDYADMRCEFSR